MKSWVEISEERLTANYRCLKEAAGADITVLAVVKADAYGHGAELCAPVLAAAGAEWLGVTDAGEGAAVRTALQRAGIASAQQPRILVMSESLDEDADVLVASELTPVVSTISQMEALAHALNDGDSARSFAVHLEIDTGMSRQGVAIGASLDEVLRWLNLQNRIHLEGVMTHFASAEIAGSHQTLQQQRCFEQALHQVQDAGLRPAWIHAGNSSTVDNPFPEDGGTFCWLRNVAKDVSARCMVRSGLALYGYSLPIEVQQGYAGVHEARIRPSLKPVMTWKTRVTGLREIEPGARIGYNGIFMAERRMRLALLPAGYADGLRRDLSATNTSPAGWVMFGKERAPIVGRVSMNLTTVDVTAIPSIKVGDEAILLGEGITADDHACIARTIPYEILCGVKSPRILS
ncbi:alanine racemase [Edaphobacter albus]|uniref:alanine racemase n=1 Tax=Edaphobacter sp. 4G125 TaxID=2763071 RepID=UPI001647F901|nr:alanine racemase [Edaphobacter sp. 4G125]QNI36754.1 alanine racemase [Edaphobacter sp. 4G125]